MCAGVGMSIIVVSVVTKGKEGFRMLSRICERLSLVCAGYGIVLGEGDGYKFETGEGVR